MRKIQKSKITIITAVKNGMPYIEDSINSFNLQNYNPATDPPLNDQNFPRMEGHEGIPYTPWYDQLGGGDGVPNIPGTGNTQLDQLIGQYLPVLISTKNTEAKEKAWGALWSYLTSPMTQSKPFTVSNELASQFLEAAVHILESYGH